jgi:hypothetical protein
VSKLAKKRDEVAAELATLRAELAEAEKEADLELQRLGARVVLHEISSEEATKKRESVTRSLDAKREKIEGLVAALPELDRRVLEEQEREHQASVRRAMTELDTALRGRHAAGRAFAKAVGSASLAAVELQRHRRRVAEARAAVEALGEEFEWPANGHTDEAWEAPPDLIAVLEEGPLQPVADAEQRRVEAEREQARLDEEKIRWYAQSPSAARLRQLPERLRSHPRVARADREHDAKIASQTKRRRTREGEREVARL